jgi:hypothetical protein
MENDTSRRISTAAEAIEGSASVDGYASLLVRKILLAEYD